MKSLQELAFVAYIESLVTQPSLENEELLFQTRVKQIGLFLENSICRNIQNEIYLKGCLNRDIFFQYRSDYSRIYQKAFNSFQTLKKEL